MNNINNKAHGITSLDILTLDDVTQDERTFAGLVTHDMIHAKNDDLPNA